MIDNYIVKGAIIMLESNKSIYTKPVIIIFEVREKDIISESHSDPNMGEWDTN